MQHLKKTRKFGRVRRQRTALIKGLVQALIKHEKITTTEAKAKSLRPIVEKMITKGKRGDLSSVRYLTARFNLETAQKITKTIAPRYQSRPGGYTRISKLPPRRSDGSPQALIELIK